MLGIDSAAFGGSQDLAVPRGCESHVRESQGHGRPWRGDLTRTQGPVNVSHTRFGRL